jgi:hypothetical protein
MIGRIFCAATILAVASAVSADGKNPAVGRTREAERPRAALLDDDLPGHDRAANARLAAALEGEGFNVERLTALQFLDPDAFATRAFEVAVLPQCASLPAQTAGAAARYLRGGGRLVFIGGPFLDNALWEAGGRWIGREDRWALLEKAVPEHRPFGIAPGEDMTGWRLSCADGRTASVFAITAEGPGGAPCLRLDIAKLQRWKALDAPAMPQLFGEGHDLFTFLARSEGESAQLSVELVERDGSRWIAAAVLTNVWKRVGLGLEDFLYWEGKKMKPCLIYVFLETLLTVTALTAANTSSANYCFPLDEGEGGVSNDSGEDGGDGQIVKPSWVKGEYVDDAQSTPFDPFLLLHWPMTEGRETRLYNRTAAGGMEHTGILKNAEWKDSQKKRGVHLSRNRKSEILLPEPEDRSLATRTGFTYGLNFEMWLNPDGSEDQDIARFAGHTLAIKNGQYTVDRRGINFPAESGRWRHFVYCHDFQKQKLPVYVDGERIETDQETVCLRRCLYSLLMRSE